MTVQFTPIPTQIVRAYQYAGLDANDQIPERSIASGTGNPCRHCLKMIPEGAAMLILAHRPFPAPQPYAEMGPLFVCADECDAGGGQALPTMYGYALMRRRPVGTFPRLDR